MTHSGQIVVATAAVLVGVFAGAAPAWAQSPPAQSPAASEDVEPRVDTSATAPEPAPAREEPALGPAAVTVSDASTPKPAVQGSPRTMDRLELDTTQITGNRELPKVLYIVPWKQSDLGDLIGKPANSLVDEILAPVDRDTFRRETRYYEALAPDGVRPASQSAAAPEK